jgi:hypothetical protein
VQRTYSPRAGETVVVHVAASAVEPTAPQAAPAGASPVASDELHQPSHFDPNAVDDYRATAQY